MLTTAKIFHSGHSQAVRLPKAFRLAGDEVWISKNEATGEITLTPKKAVSEIDALFRLIEAAEVPETFLSERDNDSGEFREIF
ncbi:MAG: AbrB/MazE/SpoVT family DNA-binding domain-containing protein [Dechloromonas sp.]|mgnify:FL=1|jgi:antitoxin VapB|nr:AbrB/MazE/SpoVT family DNA-binding domain-containing protein [Dechloromonas sp.]